MGEKGWSRKIFGIPGRSFSSSLALSLNPLRDSRLLGCGGFGLSVELDGHISLALECHRGNNTSVSRSYYSRCDGYVEAVV